MTLVFGACGGAGTTSIAVGLANAWARRGESVAALDATVAGGDLIERGADSVVTALTLESAFAAGRERPESLPQCSSASTAGASLVGRSWLDAEPPDYRRIDWYLRGQVESVVYDLGHRGFGRAGAHPLRADQASAIVVALPIRADTAHRADGALQTIRFTAGEKALSRTVVALSHVHALSVGSDTTVVREALRDHVFAVDEIPYDAHLAAGTTVTHTDLADATAAAFERIRDATARASAAHWSS